MLLLTFKMKLLFFVILVAYLADLCRTSEALVILNRADMTEQQTRGAYTIHFHRSDAIHTLANSEADRKEFLLKLQKAILEFLNKKEQESIDNVTLCADCSTLATTDSTSVVSTSPTSVVSTSPTSVSSSTAPSTASTDDGEPPPARRKKRETGDMYGADDLKFIDLKDYLRNGTFVVSLVLDTKDHDKLEEALRHIRDHDVLVNETTLSVKEYYKGLPEEEEENRDGQRAQKLACILGAVAVVILLVVLCILFSYCFIKRTHSYQMKAVPSINKTFTPSLDGAPKNRPSIADDCGWIVPMSEFDRDYKPTPIIP